MLYTAKCYWPGVTEADLQDVADRAHQQNDAGDPSRFRGLLYLRGDETVLSLFEADSAASVRRASESLGMPCERVIESGWIGSSGEGRQK